MTDQGDAHALGFDTKTLYECRGCRTVVSNHMGGCPSCGKTEGCKVERGALDGGSTMVKLPWYETIEVVVNG